MASSEAVDWFISLTGATRDVAERYVGQSRGEPDEAVLAFFADQEAAAAGAGPAAAVPERPAAATAAGLGSVDDILQAAGAPGTRQAAAASGAAAAGPATGSVRTYRVVFWADGFTLMEAEDDEDDSEDEEAPAVQAPKPPVRRTGMVTLNDLQQASGGKGGLPSGMKMPKIPKFGPLRDYESAANKEFLAAVKQGRVPPELSTTDSATGERVQISFEVSDARPKTFASMQEEFKQLEAMLEAMKAKGQGKGQDAGRGSGAASAKPPGPALFSGAGQTLSSSSSSGPVASGGAAAGAGAAAAGTAGCDPSLLALVRAAGPPVVDESKPATTLRVRLSTGATKTARLNLEHTVADLWRFVASELGETAFAAGSHELSAGFPPKPLLDNSLTIKAADLVNASVAHRSR